MYIYIYIYVEYMYVCMYGWMDGRMDGRMDVWMDGCMDVWMYGCMYACMHVCMYACMHACMHACMQAWNPQNLYFGDVDPSNGGLNFNQKLSLSLSLSLLLRHTQAHQSAIQCQQHSRQLSKVEGDAREERWPHHHQGQLKAARAASCPWWIFSAEKWEIRLSATLSTIPTVPCTLPSNVNKSIVNHHQSWQSFWVV